MCFKTRRILGSFSKSSTHTYGQRSSKSPPPSRGSAGGVFQAPKLLLRVRPNKISYIKIACGPSSSGRTYCPGVLLSLRGICRLVWRARGRQNVLHSLRTRQTLTTRDCLPPPPSRHSYSNPPPATTQFDPVLIQTIQAEVAESLVALSVSCVPYYKSTHLLRACHKAVAPSEFRNLKVNYIKETFPRPAACHISRRRETHNESLTHTASAPPRHGR